MLRFDIINHFIQKRFNPNCRYLEIGVRNPDDCFNLIKSTNKMSVDPCYEFTSFSPTFNMTSDDFFNNLDNGKTSLDKDYKWDIIFIDGLHLANQCYKDIKNSINHTSDNGIVILHDCNPPEWKMAHSDYDDYLESPTYWNGTCWKALYYARTNLSYEIYTVDTDWGIGIIDKSKTSTPIEFSNLFFEFGIMKKTRQESLGLISVEEFIKKLDF